MAPGMEPLSCAKILTIWEAGRAQHSLDRALTILAAAIPQLTRDNLADLTIGARDARLLELRTRMFGSAAECFAECPHCGERVEFSFDLQQLALPPADGSDSQEKPPNGITSRDLAEVAAAADNETAVALLLERISKRSDLPNESADMLSQAVLEMDPQAEILLSLRCPNGDHQWTLLFDVADFLWKEIVAYARNLLREIDALARAYGWTEDEILRLSAVRRQSYLEVLTA